MDWASRLLVVIVNYRCAALTLDCLRSLVPQVRALGAARVTVVDGASGDESVAQITQAIQDNGWGDVVALLPLTRNGGFAYANNRAMAELLENGHLPDYVLLLNPDTVAPPGCLQVLLDFMDSRPQAGIAGPALEDAAGALQTSAHPLPSPMGELVRAARNGVVTRLFPAHGFGFAPGGESRRCAWLSGACMIIRRAVLERIGLLDEGFFLYFEEVDYCARAGAAGWECWYVPSTRVVHKEGGSTGVAEPRRRRAGYWFASRRRFFTKHYGVLGLVAADACWSAGRLAYALRRLLGAGRGGCADPKLFTWDLLKDDAVAIFAGNAGGR